MNNTEEQQRVKALLEETIVLLCKNGLDFKTEFTVEALVGITLDKKDVVLISIKKTIYSDTCDNDNSTSGESINLSASIQEGVGHNDFNNASPLSIYESSENLSQDIQFTGDFEKSTKAHHQIEENKITRNNNENTHPLSQSQNGTMPHERCKRSIANYNSGSRKKMACSSHSDEAHNDVSPLTSHNKPINISEDFVKLSEPLCKSEPPEFDDFSSMDLDPLKNHGTLNIKWQTDDVLPDLSNLVQGTGTRTHSQKTKDSQIDGISSLLVPPSQLQQKHLSSMGSCIASGTTIIPPNLGSLYPNTSMVRSTVSLGQNQGPKGRYRCHLCFKETRLLRDLRAHMSTRHNLEKDFSCSVCGTGFTYKHNLFVHLRTVHKMNDKPMTSYT